MVMTFGENLKAEVIEVNGEANLNVMIKTGDEWVKAQLDNADMYALKAYITIGLQGKLDEFYKSIEPKD